MIPVIILGNDKVTAWWRRRH